MTWNMKGNFLPSELDQLFPKIKHHLIVISTQESCGSIAKQVFYSDSSYLEKMFSKYFKEYVMIESVKMGAIHQIVFAHLGISKYI